jgi:hypothetical protein
MAVIISATIPTSSLKKRHNALSFHRVREAIAAKILMFLKIEGKLNHSDILSKHCGHQQLYPIVQKLLLYRGKLGDDKDIDKDNSSIKVNQMNPAKVRTNGECQDGDIKT